MDASLVIPPGGKSQQWSNQAREHLNGAYFELEWAQFGGKTDGRPGLYQGVLMWNILKRVGCVHVSVDVTRERSLYFFECFP